MPWISDLRVWPYHLSEAVKAVDALIREHGLAEARIAWQMRLTGHGLGTGFAPYEQPIIAGEMGFMDELQAGMVIAFEPASSRLGSGRCGPRTSCS